VQCNADGCKFRYRRVDSFTKHYNRQHNSLIQNDEYEDVSFEPGTDAADFNENPHIAVEQNDAAQVEFNESGCRTVRELFDNVSSHVSKFILSVREQHLLPSVVHECITSSMHTATVVVKHYKIIIYYSARSYSFAEYWIHFRAHFLTVFMRLAITPPEVKRFG